MIEHPPGHAQVDFGEAIGVVGGVERKIHFFAFDLPHSDAGDGGRGRHGARCANPLMALSRTQTSLQAPFPKWAKTAPTSTLEGQLR
jgi:hypothetical protein